MTTSDRALNGLWFALAMVMGVGLVGPRVSRADYALGDGDTVVFLGDSITAARTYGKIVENYTICWSKTGAWARLMKSNCQPV